MAALRGVSSDRWEIAQFAGNDDKRGPENDVETTQEGRVLNIGWFSTGRDKAARQLLQTVQDSIRTGDINGKISFVFSNREPGELKKATCSLSLFTAMTFVLSVCPTKSSRLPKIKTSGVSNMTEKWIRRSNRLHAMFASRLAICSSSVKSCANDTT